MYNIINCYYKSNQEQTSVMIGNMSEMFSRMIGTLAVILVISAFIGGSDIYPDLLKPIRSGTRRLQSPTSPCCSAW